MKALIYPVFHLNTKAEADCSKCIKFIQGLSFQFLQFPFA